ncbi:hypothetical protein ABZU76_38450 [Amycolatopsis sp. NPDC005232]|uniref:hypothetical protein n=1 Tax=Amycolatopsis sp. NPDC005232 TaxID=3157027 RepID=UPI0033B676C0
MNSYQITVTRKARWWMVHTPEIDGLTQTRHIRKACRVARESIAVSLDLNPDDITFDVHFEP